MSTFNETQNTKSSRGWNTRGFSVPANRWSNRNSAYALTGLYFDIEEPGSRSIMLDGSGAITLAWGRGTAYQLKYEATKMTYTTVYPEPGRYDITLKGDINQITKIGNLGDTSLKGDIRAFSGLTSLAELTLQGDGITGNIQALEGLSELTKINLEGGQVTGDISDLPACLQEIRLSNAKVTGDIAAVASMPALVYLDLSGTLARSYTSASIPEWVNGIFLKLENLELPGEIIDAIINDLGDIATANGTLRLGGINGARTAASNIGLSSLLARGWHVLFNTWGATFDSISTRFDDAAVMFDDAPYKRFGAADVALDDQFITFEGEAA
jgi:hypothetical protein